MWPFDIFKKKREKAEQERLKIEKEQERIEHERLQKLEDERIEKERQKWLEENHKKAMERNARLSALREHFKGVTAEIDEENRLKAEEQERKFKAEEERQRKEREKRIELERKRKEEQRQQAEKEKRLQERNKHANFGIKPEVDSIISVFENGNIPLLQQQLYELYSKFNKPGGGRLITSFPEKDRLCEVFNLCLQYDWIYDSDIREVWSENAFYCIAEYFKVAQTKQDFFAAALDLFITCSYGKDSLKPKFNDILSKARIHPVHSEFFDEADYNGGAEYLIREFAFFSATIISPMVKSHPSIISPELLSDYETAKTDFEFATVTPENVMRKMHLISAIIGSILDSM